MKKRNIIIIISLLIIVCVGIILIVRQMPTIPVEITDEHSLAGRIATGAYLCQQKTEEIEERGPDNDDVLLISYLACHNNKRKSVFSSTPQPLYHLYHTTFTDGSESWSFLVNDRTSHNTGYYPTISE